MPVALAVESLVVIDSSDNEINVEAMPADGELMVIWLVDHVEKRLLFEKMLKAVNGEGIEVWRVDLLADYFMPRSSENVRTMSGEGVAALIEAAHKRTQKRIILAAYDRMPLPLLRGVREWQQKSASDESRLVGGVLFYPNLFGPPPIAGEAPELDPVVGATNIPLTIYQPERGTHRLRLAEVMRSLWRGGAKAFVYFVPDVRDWFFMHPLEGENSEAQLATAAERRATANVPKKLMQFAQMMNRQPKPVSFVPMPDNKVKAKQVTGLVNINNTRPAPPFKLMDVLGRTINLNDYRGKVTLVNFWVTWCPPCVEEIPSLNRLAQSYNEQPFAVVSIDFRESEATVAKFTKRVPVDFPVLVDADGNVSMSWKVFSLPSSFIIDRKGHIRYTVNRAIEWDTPEVRRKIDSLLIESEG
ncbi:MAG: redoxin domain-containing protein [Gammaproteobacteria bacterium]|nr:redoxin domain-containing protein [Gammaproteobacteria bacterium]